MREIVFATNNLNKLDEVRKILKSIKILSLKDIECFEELPETQDTIEGNAIQKAKYVKDNYGYDCFADDTGLMIKALNGRPGVYSARYAGMDCNADDNMNKVLKEMEGEFDRDACFQTVIALVKGEEVLTFQGMVEGEIIEKKSGSKGFGYDPIFRPINYDVTFAEISQEEKNKISHRGKAVSKLAEYLAS